MFINIDKIWVSVYISVSGLVFGIWTVFVSSIIQSNVSGMDVLSAIVKYYITYPGDNLYYQFLIKYIFDLHG